MDGLGYGSLGDSAFTLAHHNQRRIIRLAQKLGINPADLDDPPMPLPDLSGAYRILSTPETRTMAATLSQAFSQKKEE